jgi:TolB protein
MTVHIKNKDLRILCLLFLIATLTSNAQNDKQYRIAYNVAVKDSAGKTNYEVFSMNTDGSNRQNITSNPDVAWTYNAYEDHLFFISDRDTCYRCFFLYEMDDHGKNIKKISGLQLEDSWMDFRDNGKEIIVSGRKGKNLRYQLFIINTENGTYNQITNDTAAMYSDPAFSPDGKQIAFVYRKNKRDRTQNEELHLMNIDGTGMTQLTHYPQNDISRNENGYKAGATHWNAAENFITYISMQGGRHNIYAVAPDGKKQWKLTSNDFSEGWHDWSPDGKWLAFDMANKDDTQYHIMLMNWKTKELKQLTDATHKYQQSPVFIEIKK